MTSKRGFSLLLLLSLVVALGCGSSKTPARLSGKVTYNSKPITAGSVTLHGKENAEFRIPLNSDGTYDQAGLPAGDFDVTIETESAKPRTTMTYGAGKGGADRGKGSTSPMPQGVGGGAKGEYVKIPEKYSKKETSGEKVTLKAGPNTKDFDLKD